MCVKSERESKETEIVVEEFNNNPEIYFHNEC